MRSIFVAVFVLAGGLLAAPATAQELNLSQDLLRLGISANMQPNQPTLDSRPLFQAAVEYVRQRSIQRVTLEPGDYYFLTTQTNTRYIYLANLRDVTFAFPGVNLYFREAFQGLFAIQIVDSDRLTLTGFTVDFLELPFTQVRIAQVQSESRTIRFEPLPGFRAVTEFNDIRQSNGAQPELHGIVFRDGTVVADTGRVTFVRPLGANTVTVEADGYQSDPATIARYLPGDTLVVFGRSTGGLSVRVDGGSEIAFEDVDVYASSAMGILFIRVAAARVERVRVIPRPGTNRLISTCADGLNFTRVQGGSVMRNNEVRRTLDDGIAVNSTFLAYVQEAPAASRLIVTRASNTKFENGLEVAIVNTQTGQEVGGGKIISQTPAYDATVVSGGRVTLEFDRALPAATKDDGIVLSTPAQRGASTIVENNLVEDVLFARGIYIAGPVGLSVRTNTVRRTAPAGIVAWQAMQIGVFMTAPVRELEIVGNTVIQPMGFATPATGSYAAFGGISVVSVGMVNGAARFVTTRVNRQVTIARNTIVDSGRSGIWVTGIAQGSIRDNVITRFGRRLDLPIVGVPTADRAQLQQEFAQAIVVRASDAVEVAGNTSTP